MILKVFFIIKSTTYNREKENIYYEIIVRSSMGDYLKFHVVKASRESLSDLKESLRDCWNTIFPPLLIFEVRSMSRESIGIALRSIY